MSTETPLERAIREHRRDQAELRAFSERGYVEDGLRDVYDRWIHPDLIMMRLWAYGCSAEVSSHWDQWMLTRITCSHGVFESVSNGPSNPLGQSLTRAFRQFVKADHNVCTDRSHEPANEDNYTDLCAVCQKELLFW